MMDFNNAFSKEFISKIFELNRNYTLLKTIIEEENKFDQKYKTELCKKYQSTGKCPYGSKCRFAHGKKELISKTKGVNYKKKPCKTFNERGYCPYGSRCSFRHDERQFSETSFSYFYLQLFLFKKYNFLPSRRNYYLSQSNLINKRLSIFESLTEKEFNYNNYKDITDKNNSLSTISNTSNEENEKKCNNNELDFDGLFQNEQKGKNDKEISNKNNEKNLFNHLNKENISENIKF